ncbi:MAG: sulfite exporter TauE/SafE family protein [Chloroflexi bacterium]|nr:sulfite exporter TauE/SafE family protein [Chloroflexota bacterium]
MKILPSLMTIVFLAALVQTLSGFGFALLVMPLLTVMVGIETAAPLVALLGLTLYSINLLRYRRAVDWCELGRLGVAAALGVPVGIVAVTNIPEMIIRVLLGVVLVTYALYSLFRPVVTPALSNDQKSLAEAAVPSSRWSYGAGFLAGCLGGAYNVPGPPVVVYGSASQWPKDEFRAMLQSLFLLQGTLVVVGHGMTQHLTTAVLQTYLTIIPTLLLGIFIGSQVDGKVDKARFHTLVTVMILLSGVVLLINW